MARCKTPERRLRAVVSLSPPPPPGGYCKGLSKRNEETEIIPSFLPCSLSLLTDAPSSSNAAMVARASDINQRLGTSRLAAKRIRLASRPTPYQSRGTMDLKDIVKSLPPLPLFSISTMKSESPPRTVINPLHQTQTDELLVQKNFMAKSA